MIFMCPIYLLVYRKFRDPIFQKNLQAREKAAEYFQVFMQHLEYLEDIVIDADYERENSVLKKKNQNGPRQSRK